MVSAEVDKYQTAILKSRDWYTSPEFGETKLVTNHKDATWMSDADAHLYYSMCESAAHAAGYRMPKGNCPKLVMDTKLHETENTLLDVHAPITTLTSKLAATHPELRTQALELSLNLAGGIPGFTREAAMPTAVSLICELKTDPH